MSRQKPWARWTLPDEIDPAERLCFMVPVPNNIAHIAAFKGAIYELSKAYSWQNDPAHTAIDVAAVWRGIFDGLEPCVEQVQFRTVASCVLEASFDGGETWEAIFDASDCANEVIQERIDDGTLSPGSTQPPGGQGDGGHCYRYHVRLDANGRWIAPIAVGAGDVISVSGTFGAWHDGSAGSWQCPDGYAYALGSCLGIGNVTDAGDPAPSLYHMRLIGHIAGEAAPYFDLFNASYTVVGATPQDLTIQANDASLGDNSGSVVFDIEICKGEWCIEYNFLTSNQGWTTAAHAGEPGCRGNYYSGTGWVGDCQPGGTFQRISIGKTLDLVDAVVTKMQIDVSTAAGAASTSQYFRTFGVDVRNLAGAGSLPTGNSTITVSGLSLTADNIQWITIDSSSGSPVTIKKIRFYGTGVRPPEPNC